ncbi:sphingomyelin phosphodiesterase [Auricularia subglabra TFB-10046 SS5]|nr:sphingomyelin phosphodiesterase [Auricularia subglabra TFB-10046 SS5]
MSRTLILALGFAVATAQQQNATELVNEIAAQLLKARTCDDCHALLVPVQQLAQLGDAPFSAGLVGICQAIGAADADVCAGAVGMQAPIIAHAMRSISTQGQTATKVCDALFGLCAPPPVNAFAVPLPPKPKPQRPHAPLPAKQPPLTVVHMSDVHIDRDYTVGAEANCTKPICCRNFADSGNAPPKVPAGPFGDSACDAPVGLADAMLKAVKKLNPDFAIFTGDVVEHDIWLVDREEATTDMVAFNSELASFLGRIPVFPTLGNHDTAPVNSFPRSDAVQRAPNNSASSSQWVFDTQAQGWARWIGRAGAQEVRHVSGSYAAVVPGTKLRVISLNTQYAYKQNFWLYDTDAVVHDPQGLLAFVARQLQEAEDCGEKAWIIGHIPSGKSDFLADQSNYFDQIVQRYEDTLAGNFFGHTHVDQFEIAYSDFSNRTGANAVSVNMIAPSVTPTSGNPAFKVYTLDSSTYALLDVRVFSANLTSPTFQTTGPVFSEFYSARASYGPLVNLPADAPLSPAFWHTLTEVFERDDAAFQLYNTRISRGGKVGACTGACKTQTICGLRAARSQDNCDVVTPGLPFKRADSDGHGHAAAHDCEGVTIAALLRNSQQQRLERQA